MRCIAFRARIGSKSRPAKASFVRTARDAAMMDETTQVERFTESHLPPQLPVDPFFKLEITNEEVWSVEPWRIGNAMLDLPSVTVLKVNHQKFTIGMGVSES